jgi:TetR/AcrR family transcriptional regulator
MPPKRSGAPVPQRRDPAATRRKLLTAARLEFARHGFAGARVDEIAERAGVNKQLVYHHFGDKDALYLAVLEWVYADIREQERKLNLQGLAPDKAIRKLIEASFDYLSTNPDFIVLLNDENRGGARHVRGSTRLEAMHSPLVVSVSHILNEGVRAGMFRKGIDPVQLYISIAALGYFYLSNTPTLSAIFGKDLSTRTARRTRRRHVVDLVLQSLRP